jgi:phosphoglycerate dehydrogenase-like enzyme
MRSERQPVRHTVPGIFDSVVGLVSVGSVARHLISLLKPFRLRIVAFDPYLSPEQAKSLGIELVSLDQLFEISHVVSLHTPALPETEGMIRGGHFSRMIKSATFINTARGSVVNEREMIDVLTRRSDLQAILDVTHPEPPSPDSLLFSLPNVILTPHIAGPLDQECRRLGSMAVDEFERYVAGQPLRGEVTEKMMETIA